MEVLDIVNCIEVMGKTGKILYKPISELKVAPKVAFNQYNNSYEVYIDRWYKLPRSFTTIKEASEIAVKIEQEYLEYKKTISE